ncbi:RNA polymerase sigma factor [Nocardia sp. NPDC059239]|uniref:RNA polymerase sigma factor n=1 Tax=unclassified Nocardia TaxID=2637762 RepID=UPI0036AC4FBF
MVLNESLSARAMSTREDSWHVLVRSAQTGDAMAMHELLHRLEPMVGAWCGPIALSDAADAAQETLTIVFRKLGGLSDPERLHGWVRRIAIRSAVRIARARSAAEPAPADWLEQVPARDDPELRTDVLSVLRRLVPEQRAVLVLRHIEGLSDREIAAALGIAESTVRSRLFRARRHFRREWQQ